MWAQFVVNVIVPRWRSYQMTSSIRPCWLLLSVRVSGMSQTEVVLRPGWFSDTAPHTLLMVSMWTWVSHQVSARCRARCKRYDFCCHLNVTLRMLFFSCSQTTDEEWVPSKRLVNNYNFCAQISFTFYPFYCAGSDSFFEYLLPCACNAYANYLDLIMQLCWICVINCSHEVSVN